MKASVALALVAAILFGLGTFAIAQPEPGGGDQAISSIRVRVGDRLLCFASQDPGSVWTVDGPSVRAEGPHGQFKFTLAESGGIQVAVGELVYEVPEVRVLSGGQQVMRGWTVAAEGAAEAIPIAQPAAQPVAGAPSEDAPAPPESGKAAVGAPSKVPQRPSFRVQNK